MRTVLLIDDDAQFRSWAVEFFREHGWQTMVAADGDEGLRLARRHQPDVVVCDLLMPRCNGFVVCSELRKSESLRHTTIVVLSGRDFEIDRQEAIEAGADVYLTKPVDPGQLLMQLSRADANPLPGKIWASEGQAEPVSAGSAEISAGRLRFWGVRGSIPTPGPGTVRYGGNTSCLEFRVDGQMIVLDAGTGLRLLGRQLTEEYAHQPLEITMLLTHTHWDHIQGLPFFLPLLRPHWHLRILGYEGARHGLDNLLTSQMETPFFPVGMREVSANVRIEELKNLNFSIGPVRVEAVFANHPGICVGYRLWTSSGSIAFFPDHEAHSARERWPQTGGTALEHARREHAKLAAFLRGVDVLIMDTQYDGEEYLEHLGWGHGCLDDVVALALEAKIKRLYLFHHDPDHDDAKIEAMVAHARRLVAGAGGALEVDAAAEGAVVELSCEPVSR